MVRLSCQSAVDEEFMLQALLVESVMILVKTPKCMSLMMVVTLGRLVLSSCHSVLMRCVSVC